MEIRSIDDLYRSNEKIHEKFRTVVTAIADEHAAALPDGEKWSVAQIVEHVSIVEGGILRICSKLLGEAEAAGQANGGELDFAEFMRKVEGSADTKLEAPERVHPVNGRSIAESLDSMKESGKAFDGLREKFEMFDGNAFKFPHPYFGDLSAVEWLALSGGHKARHLAQIKRVVEKCGIAAEARTE